MRLCFESNRNPTLTSLLSVQIVFSNRRKTAFVRRSETYTGAVQHATFIMSRDVCGTTHNHEENRLF